MDQKYLRKTVGVFAAKHLQRSETALIIDPMPALGTLKKWTYSISEHEKQLLSIVQAVQVEETDRWRHQHYLLAIAMFKTLGLKQSECPEIIGFERVGAGSEMFDLVAIKPCPGKTLQEHFPDGKRALERFGKALAELHASKLNKKGIVGGSYLEIDALWTERFSNLLQSKPDWLPEDEKKIAQRLREISAKIDPRTSLVGILHGDPIPTNILYDPTSDRLTFIDMEWMAQSFDASGNPIGSIAQDYSKARESLRSFGYLTGISQNVFHQWINIFSDAYRSLIGNVYPLESQLRYYSTLFWMREVVRADRKLKRGQDGLEDYRTKAVIHLMDLLFKERMQ